MQDYQSKLQIFNTLQDLYTYCIKTKQRASQIVAYYQDKKSQSLDQYQFGYMLSKILPQSPANTFDKVFIFITQKYQVPNVNGELLDQIMLNLQKQQQDNPTQAVQQSQQPTQYIKPTQQTPPRTTRQILELFQDILAKIQVTTKQIYQKYDANRDNMMNKHEFTQMLYKVVKDLTEVEINTMFQELYGNNQELTLFAFEKSFRQQPPQTNVLESNYYENPNNARLLQSNIQFDEYHVSDYSIPAMKEFVEKFNQLKQSRQLYFDPTFPANATSLGSKFNFEWKRPQQFIKGPINFFVKDSQANRFGIGKWITPNDLQQGALGDCYFLASISSLGNRRPDLMLDAFVTRTANQYGIYCVKLCIDGGWKAIAVDDLFPVQYDKPAFTRGRDNELWVMVIEKAWAKVFGSYQNIAAGFPREVLRSLTGAPTQTLFISDLDFITRLEECIKSRCIMVCATVNESNLKNFGLVPGHAYTVLKIKDITHPSRGKVRLIKLRNPWGKEEWKGDWSDDSALWTKQLRQELKLSDSNDGVFYMDIGSFMQFFSDVQVCFIREQYKYSFVYAKSDKHHSKYYSLAIPMDGEYYITVTQKNKRFQQSCDYSCARILVQGRECQGIQKIDGEVWCLVRLERGNCRVQVKVKWEYQNEGCYNLSVYGPGLAQITMIPKQKDIIKDMLLIEARQNKQMKDYGAHGQASIKKVYEFNHKTGYGYYYVINNSDKTFTSDVTLTEMKGLKLRKPHRGSTLRVELEPKQEFLATLTVSHTGYGFQLKESFLIK